MTELLKRGLESLKTYETDGYIIIHNYNRPMKERIESRKHVGPYLWKPSTPGKGRGFYCASTGLACDSNGSTFNLRLEYANDHLNGRLSDITGYYCDEDGDGDTLQPIIARLPHGRGYLAGWTMGQGMCASIDCDIWETIEDCAREAHRMAEYDAEESINRSAKEREDEDDDEDDDQPEPRAIEGALVQTELEIVAAFKMIEESPGLYRDPEDGTLNRFNRATGIMEEVSE